MKKFTRSLLCLGLCAIGLGAFGCDTRTPEEKAFTYPASQDVVYGNGGLAVQKGNYLYFVNGYQSYNVIKATSTYTHGALMLAKLDSYGGLITDENENIDDEYYISMSNRLCGYEATDLTIFGNYLYFTTPCIEEQNKVLANDRVVFYRIKLDKTSKVEKLYQTEVSNSSVEFKYYEENGKVVLMVYEKGSNLDHEEITNRLIRVGGGATEIARDITSVVMGDNTVFFTVDSNIKTCNPIANTTENFVTSVGDEKLVFAGGNKVFTSLASTLKEYNVSTKDGRIVFNNYDTSTYKFYLAPNAECVVMIGEKMIQYIECGTLPVQETSYSVKDNDGINFIAFTNGQILYRDDNKNIKAISYANRVGLGIVTEVDSMINTLDMETTYFDIDEGYMYFFRTVDEKQYLFRISIDSSSDAPAEFVGVK